MCVTPHTIFPLFLSFFGYLFILQVVYYSRKTFLTLKEIYVSALNLERVELFSLVMRTWWKCVNLGG